MDRITRRIAASAVAVSLAAVSVSASAERDDASRKVTSAQIKNGTIQGRDLSSALRTAIASALHGVPANAIGTDQVAPNSLTAADLAPGSVGASEVADGTLSSADLSSVHGVATDLDFPSIGPGTCQVLAIDTGNNLTTDLLLVTPGPDMPSEVTVKGRQDASNPTYMDLVACNVSGAAVNPAPLIPIAWAVIEN